MSLEILSAGPMFLRYDSLEQVSRVELRWSKERRKNQSRRVTVKKRQEKRDRARKRQVKRERKRDL